MSSITRKEPHRELYALSLMADGIRERHALREPATAWLQSGVAPSEA
jgi:hypothetical protein